MKYKHIIIDGNNRFYKSYYTKNNAGYSGITNFISHLQWLEQNLVEEDYTIHIVFDPINVKGDTSKRKLIDPDYKSNRKEKSDDFYFVLSRLKEVLLNYSSRILLYENQEFEADDFVPIIINRIREEENPMILISSEDEDWMRCVDSKVHWFAKSKIFNPIKLYELKGYGVTKHSVILTKVFKSDKSDNIKSPLTVKISEKDLAEIRINCLTISDLINKIDILHLKEDLKNDIIKNKSRLEQNYKLIDFMPMSDDDFEISITKAVKNNIVRKQMYIKLHIDYKQIEPDLLLEERCLTGNKIDLFGDDEIRV